MKNVKGKKVMIANFLTSDPINKQGQIGIVTDVKIIDIDNFDVTVKFEDGVIGVYENFCYDVVE